MTTPPSGTSSGPSPTPSSSSSNIRQPFTMSHIQDPSRASSAASHASSSRAEKHGATSNGVAPGADHHHYDYSQQTPQAQPLPPMPNPGGPFPNTNPAAYLPQVTSSPPPQVPTYVPPPQHAMAPDPIHDGPPGPSMMGPWQGTQPPQWAPGGPPYGMQPGVRMMPPGRSQGGSSGLPPNTEPYPSRGVPMNNAMYPPHVMMGLGGRPGSSHGEGRDRRRDRERHRDDEDGRDSREDEVISTIFVVGFPDDMGEREFQNIFTFAPGFEAATLKFPSGSRRPEPTAALLAELQQIAVSQQAAAAAGEHYEMPPTQPALEEALAALQMGGTASTSTSTTPSAAMSMTPSAPSAAAFGGGLPQLPTRRQTIGFARFRTRPDAIAAKEQLQGRKIDYLTGATLKAEMAKKNLHQKRATSGEELVGLLLRSGRLAGLMNPAIQGGMMQGIPPQPQAMAPPPIPNQPPASAREAWNSWPQQPQDEKYAQPTEFPYPASGPAPQPLSSLSNPSTSPPSSVRSPNAPPTDSKALLALAEEADEMDDWPLHSAQIGLDGFTPPTSSGNPGSGPGGPIQTDLTGSRRERSSNSSSGDPSLAFSPPLNHLSNPASASISTNNMRVPNQYGQYGREGMPNSPPGGSDRLSEGGRVMGGNPADQNPPINTLYVGNLPAISPPTHPPNFLEESLRALFSRCAGYKRMSFRQKINGPMCFVEFEDVPFAAHAIKDLYGHNLGGLVKGGIRLSYSKNSLGQRGNAHSSGNNSSLFGGIAHTVALAGMSPSSSAKTLHSPTSYGLQLSQGPPSAGTNGPASAPIPMPDLRRHSEVTALSPTAQPFNLATSATSPRTRYFGSSPSGLSTSANSQHSAEQAYSYSASAQAIPNSGSSNGLGGGQFSPVSPPIRTPASFSWVSSGNGNVAGVGNGGYGLDGFTWSNGGSGMQ